MRRIVSWGLIIVLILANLTGCAQRSDKSEKIVPIVRLNLEQEPVSMDPQIGSDRASAFVNGHTMEGLVRIWNNKVYPGMAERWEVSEDGLVYTFHLRDAVWSDGVQVTAQNFYDGFLRLLDPNLGSYYGSLMGGYIRNGGAYVKGKPVKKNGMGVTTAVEVEGKKAVGIESVGIRVIDQKTFEIFLAHPTSYFLKLLGLQCFLPVRGDLIEKYGRNYCSEVDKMPCNGPFIPETWIHERGMILKKNKTYWNAKEIHLKQIELPIIAEAKTAVEMYNTGELTMASIPAELAEKYLMQGSAQKAENGAVFWIQINYRSMKHGEILRNKNFRKAISSAIDRQALVKAIFKGSIPANRYIPSVISGMGGDTFDRENPLDAISARADDEAAKMYFEQALRELHLTRENFPTLELLGTDSFTSRLFCEAVQDMVRNRLGIELKVKIVPAKQRLQMVNAGEYQLAYANWLPDYDDPMTYLELWVSGANRSGYSNGTYDALIAQAKATQEAWKRQKLMAEAEKILMEDMAVIPTHFGVQIYVASIHLKHMLRSVTGTDPDLVYATME